MAVLIALTSVSVTAAVKLHKYCRYQGVIDAMRTIKKPSLKRLGFFLSVVTCGYLSGSVNAGSTRCPAVGEVQRAELAAVVDGDTLRLSDGRRLRVIAVNTPELARDSRPRQALALEAKAAVIDFFRDDPTIVLQVGRDSKDRYGRMLAHVFRVDGTSLAEYLIGRGLGWQLVMPPNERYWLCLQGVERLARQQSAGVWSLSGYKARSATNLSDVDVGFQRVEGIVNSVSRGRQGWWLHMGKLAIRLQDSDLGSFDGIDPQRWLHQPLTIRGWVIDRSDSRVVKSKGYPPFMVSLRHPGMLE